MIVQKHFFIGAREYIHTWSNDRRYVVRDGMSFDEAYDPAEFGRTYTEGELIPTDDTALADKAEAYDILMGVNT